MIRKLCAITFLFCCVLVQAQSPNIVLIYLDDMGWDLSCYGHPTIRTPNIDKLAQEGMRFTQFYSASPACTASRYGLLTGRCPVRSGMRWVLEPHHNKGIHPQEITLAEALREVGYKTAIFGKWHLGSKHPYMPLQNGFDEYCGLLCSNDMIPPRWPVPYLIKGNKGIVENPDQSIMTKQFTDMSLDFIMRHKKGPFFVYLSHPMPHVPLYPGKDFQGKSRRGLYGDVIEEIDFHVGRIISFLREENLANNTLVLVISDNGPWIIKGGRGGSAGFFRDGKGSTWEGGIRVPCVIWWPGTIPGGIVSLQVSSTLDIYATCLTIAGAKIPQDRIVDGIDVSSVWKSGKELKDHPPLFFYGPAKLHAVRKGPWKLHVTRSSQTSKKYFKSNDPLLFQLERDPSENWNVAAEHPQKVEELLAEIAKHHAEKKLDKKFSDQ